MELNPLSGGSVGQVQGNEVNFPRDGDLHQVAIPVSEGQGEPSPHREFWTKSSDPRASAR